jgi:hypothetical protein
MTIRHTLLPPGATGAYQPGWARVAAQLRDRLRTRS